MTIDIQRQPNCAATLIVDCPPDEVRTHREAVVAGIARQARLPGYRPGKAPVKVIETKFKEDIEAEVLNRLLNHSINTARKEHGLKIIGFGKIEPDFAPDMSFHMSLDLTIEPEFELPDYTGIPVSVAPATVSEKDIDEFIEIMRERDATFEDVEGRPAQMEDYVVTDGEGFQGDRPLAEVFTDLPKNVASHKNLWIRLMPDVFLPGFAGQVEGMSVGETREFDLDIPADFVLRQLAGEKLRYRVTLTGLKRRILPEVDDAFARKIGGRQSLAEFRQDIAGMLKSQKEMSNTDRIRNQVSHHLATQLDFEVPATHVHSETRRIVDAIVEENTMRGVPEDVLKQSSGEIVSNAADAAQRRVRLGFILQQIARREGIKLTDEEFQRRLFALARRAGRDPKALLKDVKKNNNLGALQDQFIEDLALEFVISKAKITEAEQGAIEEGAAGQAPGGESSS